MSKTDRSVIARSFRAAFPQTIPILAGLLFLGMAYGIYMNVSGFSWGLPELIAGGVTVALHLWQRKMLLYIAAGTVVYMLLVQLVF